jgi:hypothetical protein
MAQSSKRRKYIQNPLTKTIELINWVLENMKNPDIQICSLIESKMNEIIVRVNKMDSAIKSRSIG